MCDAACVKGNEGSVWVKMFDEVLTEEMGNDLRLVCLYVPPLVINEKWEKNPQDWSNWWWGWVKGNYSSGRWDLTLKKEFEYEVIGSQGAEESQREDFSSPLD